MDEPFHREAECLPELCAILARGIIRLHQHQLDNRGTPNATSLETARQKGSKATDLRLEPVAETRLTV